MWISSNPAPAPWPRGAVSCPACGRDIPGSTRPRSGKANRTAGPGWTVPVEDDLVARCAIDGDIGDGLTPSAIGLEAITSTTLELAAECERNRELRWASMLRKAASRRVEDRDVHIAHALTIFYRRGPWTGGVVPVDSVALRQTIVDIVAAWPSRTA